MNAGRIVQVGTPTGSTRPADRFVADHHHEFVPGRIISREGEAATIEFSAAIALASPTAAI
jgi:ABC-type Fe3+/spermidine/putrescine transport system ATPase subunit